MRNREPVNKSEALTSNEVSKKKKKELREEPREAHWGRNFLVSQAVSQSFNPDVKAVQSIPPASSFPSIPLSVKKLTAVRIADHHERDSESLGRPSLQLKAFPKYPSMYSAPISSSLFSLSTNHVP